MVTEVLERTPGTCPQCGATPLWHSIGEDEFGGSELIPYDRIECLKCFWWTEFVDYIEMTGEYELANKLPRGCHREWCLMIRGDCLLYNSACNPDRTFSFITDLDPA
jgi:hypothetical protein